jgi:hypothetical protein
MITEKNFVQIQYDAEKIYMEKTKHRYATAGEKSAASNSYIQGRVDAVADMENLVVQHNVMLKERNRLAKELEKYTKVKVEPAGDLGL